MRVVVAGMGSAIGTAVTRQLEANPDVEAILGFDLEPPRRWMRRAEFHFCRPEDATRVEQLMTDFGPTTVIHCWVFEPRARSSPGQARARTVAGTESLLKAVESVVTQSHQIERIVVRSDVSVYGHRSGRTAPPTTTDTPQPTTTFGRMVDRVERRSAEVGTAIGADVVPVRLAAITASTLPNPLGRYLRLPAVPVPITSRRFGVVHLEDAAAVIATAAATRCLGPINVSAPDPVTPIEAVSLGGRLPLPVLPLALRLGRSIAELAGTPLPEHVVEMLTRGQVVEPTDLLERLGVALSYTTPEVLEDLYSLGRIVDVGESQRDVLNAEVAG